MRQGPFLRSVLVVWSKRDVVVLWFANIGSYHNTSALQVFQILLSIANEKDMGIKPKVISYKCPWQNGVSERFVLSVRNDMLNQMIIFNEEHLRDFMNQYFEYYNNERCHLAVWRDSPNGREIQNKPFKSAKIISSPRIGGLHHMYRWNKAA